MELAAFTNPAWEADVKAAYKIVNGISLPIHYFFPAHRVPDSPIPAVVCIHGGSWRARKDNSPWDGGLMAPQARYFASRGCVGITISYRDFPPPDLPRESGSFYPVLADLISDCRNAIVYITEHAVEYGIDTRRIAVIGDSAGGHLAACLATIGNTGKTGRVSAAIACNAIMDLTDPKWLPYAACSCTQTQAIKHTAACVSPLYHIKPGIVPMLVMHGLADDCVFPSHSIRFSEKMKQCHNRCDLVLFPNTGHAFIIAGYTATDQQIAAAMRTADAFLVSLGFFDGRPGKEEGGNKH